MKEIDRIYHKFEGSNINETIKDLEHQRDDIYKNEEDKSFNRVINAMKQFKQDNPNREFF